MSRKMRTNGVVSKNTIWVVIIPHRVKPRVHRDTIWVVIIPHRVNTIWVVIIPHRVNTIWVVIIPHRVNTIWVVIIPHRVNTIWVVIIPHRVKPRIHRVCNSRSFCYECCHGRILSLSSLPTSVCTEKRKTFILER